VARWRNSAGTSLGDEDAWSTTGSVVSPMLRGDIHLINLDPVVGDEANKHRPAVIVRRRTGLPRDSKAQAEQIHSVSLERVEAALGHLPADLLTQLDDAIRVHLDL
jgi:mRNA interferase MazF